MSMGKSNATGVDLEPTSIGDEEVATHQEDVAVPLGAGRRLVALRWVTEATHRREKQAPDEKKGKK